MRNNAGQQPPLSQACRVTQQDQCWHFSFSWYYKKLSGKIRTATAWGVVQVFHTHWTSRCCGWLRGVWCTKFQFSLLIISSPHCYLFTSVMGWICVHTVPKYGTKPTIQYVPSTLEISTAQLCSITEIASPQPFLWVSTSPFRYDFCGSAKAIRFSVNIT